MLMRFAPYGLWALVLCLPGLGLAAEDAQEYTLDNGLKLIVKPDHRAPVVVSQVWYKVGSSYEQGGSTGISHVLEHMMFKGTPAHPAGEFSRLVSERGGEENAFTGRDYTAYYQRLGSKDLELSFQLEADRMRNLLLDPKEFAKELKVVMEERRLRTDDDPQALTSEQFHAVAFLNNPYRYPVIGWMGDLEHLSVEDLHRWYRKWYAPNNATVVVVGDVDPQRVLALARKYFGALPAEPIIAPKPRSEPEQHGTRSVAVSAPAEVPYLIMGYPVPVLKTAKQDWEPYALAVLAAVLDGGESARLARNLVRGSRVAASAGAGYNLYARLADLFLLEAVPAEGHTVDDLRQALLAEVKRLREEPVAPAELERVKAQVAAGKVYELDSMFRQAMQMGLLETVGLDWRLWAQFPARVRAVTPEQVREVARKYLGEERLVHAVLVPEGKASGKRKLALGDQADVR
jgi:zinc protease